MNGWRPTLSIEQYQEAVRELSKVSSASRHRAPTRARTPGTPRDCPPPGSPGPTRLLSTREIERFLRGSTMPGELAALLGKTAATHRDATPRPERTPEPSSSENEDQEVRHLLRQAANAFSEKLMALLEQEAPSLGRAGRQELLAHIQRLYTRRAIGKGFSSIVHNLWTVLENQDSEIDADRLRLFRDTLERLYACPRMSYAQARTLRKDLKDARLPVQNRELRHLLVDAIVADRA